jgi:lipopolysaccharide transport system ATP-binding protein
MRIESMEEVFLTKPAAIAPVGQETVLSIEHLSKKFCRDLRRAMFYAVKDIAGEVAGLRNGENRKLRKGEFWALNDISFTLKRGEAVGIVGANGAGKTTLLKIVSGLIKPDHGQVKILGKLAPLIALGAGFNTILSGRENIYVNMSILGLSKQQIDERIQEVIDFAEIDHAIDAPVSTYSSGMAARLGFSCAIHTDPDILLIDEVLAVGDVRFRMKCYRKLAELKAKGRSFLLVSHSASSVLSVCTDAIYLKKGVLIQSGEVQSVLASYESDLFGVQERNSFDRYEAPRKSLQETTGIDIESVHLEDVSSKEVNVLITGQDYKLVVRGFAHRGFSNVGTSILLKSLVEESHIHFDLDSRREMAPFEVKEGPFQITLAIPAFPLAEGTYTLKINVNTDRINILDGVESFLIHVIDRNRLSMNSTFFMPRNWSVTGILSK